MSAAALPPLPAPSSRVSRVRARLQRRLTSLLARLPGRRALGAGMALYLLSPVVAELCLGATPWFFYPIWGWVLMLMYGGGAILMVIDVGLAIRSW